MQSSNNLCRCDFAEVSWSDKCAHCSKCNLSYDDIQKIALRARDIPFRQWQIGRLTWEHYERLVDEIDNAIWIKFEKESVTGLGQKSLRCYFQEKALKTVQNIMLRHNLCMEQLDVNIFRSFQPSFHRAESQTVLIESVTKEDV